MQIIDGKKLAEKIKDEVVQEIVKLNGGRAEQALKRPNLAIVLVGGREDSKLYVAKKEAEAKKVGIDTHLYKCDEQINERELLEMIKCLNEDELIDAILVQLPLPAGIDTDAIILAIDPAKDVDGFHPNNLEKLLRSRDFKHGIMPPVFAVVLAMLKSIDCRLSSKEVCLISNSEIFGKSLAHVLECQGAKVELANAKDPALAEKTGRADILITAAGQPKFIKKKMIKNDAVIIDIGITRKGKQVFGDVDFLDVKNKAGYITPVPGGVGPMTIAMAFKNTVELYRRRHKKHE